jgi:hypothetical protein
VGDDAVTVGAGESKVIPLHFNEINGCEKGFELAFGDALVLGTAPIQLDSLRFTD